MQETALDWLLTPLALLFLGWLLWQAWVYFSRQTRQQQQLVDRINALLPQTQCGQCSYEGCLPYARAIAKGEKINKCPPGGRDTILRLSNLLHEAPVDLDPAHGEIAVREVAVIREAECIGCTKCIRACPVDAILGAPKLMHTVIASECTGCDLCVAPCPVDCIDMVPLANTSLPAIDRLPEFPPATNLETAAEAKVEAVTGAKSC
jgi:electron transport complex protein RnfB